MIITKKTLAALQQTLENQLSEQKDRLDSFDSRLNGLTSRIDRVSRESQDRFDDVANRVTQGEALLQAAIIENQGVLVRAQEIAEDLAKLQTLVFDLQQGQVNLTQMFQIASEAVQMTQESYENLDTLLSTTRSTYRREIDDLVKRVAQLEQAQAHPVHNLAPTTTLVPGRLYNYGDIVREYRKLHASSSTDDSLRGRVSRLVTKLDLRKAPHMHTDMSGKYPTFRFNEETKDRLIEALAQQDTGLKVPEAPDQLELPQPQVVAQQTELELAPEEAEGETAPSKATLKLNPSETQVFDYLKAQGSIRKPVYAQIAAELGIVAASFCRALQKLETHGAIRVERYGTKARRGAPVERIEFVSGEGVVPAEKERRPSLSQNRIKVQEFLQDKFNLKPIVNGKPLMISTSLDEIAKHTGISRDVIRNELAVLEVQGMIELGKITTKTPIFTVSLK